jgi:hypothetical protein
MSTCKPSDLFCDSICKKVNGTTICMHHVIIICVILIFLYGIIVRKYLKKDILEYKFGKCTGCDYWAVTHFLFFVLLGYLWPNLLVELAIIGVLWEFIETYLGTRKLKLFGKRIQLIGATDDKGNVIEEKEDQWWYGRVSDIAFNTVGLVIGWKLSQIYPLRT